MSDVTDIIESCSQWELDRLREMGVRIPAGVKGKTIEDVHVPDHGAAARDSDVAKYHQRRKVRQQKQQQRRRAA